MKGIAQFRNIRGLTQQELADRIGVNRSALAMWEAEKSWPPSALLPRIAEALGVSIDDLYCITPPAAKEVS